MRGMCFLFLNVGSCLSLKGLSEASGVGTTEGGKKRVKINRHNASKLSINS